jgi:EmrB/QacA subfamily drug resistance transporter
MLMSAIDTTVVILALPTIVSDLSSSLLLAVWTIIGYLLVVAVFTTQIGSLGDAFGRGKIFAMGFTVFTIGSLLCGLSGTMLELVSFRIVQGFGAAMLQSCSSALIADAFPAAARGKAFGYTTLGWNVGGTLGIVLGGVITTFLGWRFIFFINIPVGILGVYLARVTLRHEPGQIPRLDYPGMAILGSILLLLVYAATQLASAGISNLVLLLIMVALLLLPPFVYVEKRSANPIIRIGPLLSRTLGVPLFTSFLQAAGYLSVVFILILYLQGIRGYTPLYSSLLLVPGYVAASFLAPYMGRLSDRMGPRIVATAGIALIMLSVTLYLFLTVNTQDYYIITASLLGGIGGSMFWPANNSSIMAGAPTGTYGSVSGLSRTLSNVGTLVSYVLAISVAASAIGREAAFRVFLGSGNVIGGLEVPFLSGIKSAFLVSVSLLLFAGVLSSLRPSSSAG